MLTKKNIKQFSKRISNYSNFTTEKEIETEFYKFISKYYENKYTDFGRGVIHYTAPHNIDGLLEVRTLDVDYRILVEAKANKNYKNKIVRNEVLSQAIYYCRRLNHSGEMLPAIILLIEKYSMIVIKAEELKILIEEDHNNLSACAAHKNDEALINELNSTDYNYDYYNFKKSIDYNKIFDSIDSHNYSDDFKITKSKNFTKDTNMIIFNEFIENNKNIIYYNGVNNYNKYIKSIWFIYDDLTKRWRESDSGEIKGLLLKFINSNNYMNTQTNLTFLSNLLKDFYTVSSAEYIRFNNCLVNMKTGTVVDHDKSYFYIYEFNHDFFNITINNSSFLTFDDFIHSEKKIFIDSDEENYPIIARMCFYFNKSISNFNVSNDSDVIVFDDLENLEFKNTMEKLSYENCLIGKIDGKIDLNHLFNLLIGDPASNFGLFKITNYYINQWEDANDLILTWFNECIEVKENSFILVLDLLDSFNAWLTESGNVKVSLRFFGAAFKAHNIFRDNAMAHKRNTYVSKKHTQSHYNDPNDPTAMPRTAGAKSTYILGIAFK